MLGIYRLYAGQIRLLAFWPRSLKNWHTWLWEGRIGGMVSDLDLDALGCS